MAELMTDGAKVAIRTVGIEFLHGTVAVYLIFLAIVVE
jgi:hypothetical protein